MSNRRFLQIAFNNNINEFYSLINKIPNLDNIIIEAGTPLIKKEGISVIGKIKAYWHGEVCADIKIVDGAKAEVLMCKQYGADYVTAMGNSSVETLKIFVDTCKEVGIKSVIDMINTENPLKILWKANVFPDVVVIHRGRDEENSFGKVIQYKNIAKIKGKWDLIVGSAGGIDKRELQSAAFNGSDLVDVNVVNNEDPWSGLVADSSFGLNIKDFIKFIN